MGKRSKSAITLWAALLGLAIGGCQAGGGARPDTTVPLTVEATGSETVQVTEIEPSVAAPETTAAASEQTEASLSGEAGMLAWLGEARLDLPQLPPGFETADPEAGVLEIPLNSRRLTFNAQGFLTALTEGERQLTMEGLTVDLGWNTRTVLGQSGYTDMDQLQTWDLPVLAVRDQPLPEKMVRLAAAYNEDAVLIRQNYGPILWDTTYEDLGHALRVTVDITNLSGEAAQINGVNFVLRGVEVPLDAMFEYPGSLPYGRFGRGSGTFNIIATYYSSPLTHITSQEGQTEVLFVNESEKWRTASYFDHSGSLGIQHLSATQAELQPGHSLTVGSMYLQLPETDDPYDLSHVRDLYASLGWSAPTDGAPPGPVYIGHPYGTMDTGFSHPRTLQEYAEELPRIKGMGYDYVWLLPIFTHPGDWVYAPPDQTEIDPRYGGREGAAAFIARAHEEGLGVLFDLVPHGPFPDEPIVSENPGWPSRDREGRYQIEWDNVSFDYNNPDYMAYTYAFVRDYASALGLDGARIDSAMGGLPNWTPQPGFRPSESGLRAGTAVTETVRRGIKDGGRRPLILPENFHPVPQYAPFSDLFYDMTLYRLIYELRTRDTDDVTLAQTLTHWLRMQREAAPDGLVHLRYLSNHDTADWTWDAARPLYVHGEARAKALWVILSLVDGVPLLHAGDENSGLYHRAGTDLSEFFTELNTLRGTWTETTAPTVYRDREDAVVDFYRLTPEGRTVLRVLVNLGGNAAAVMIPGDVQMLMGEGSRFLGERLILEGNGYAVLEWDREPAP